MKKTIIATILAGQVATANAFGPGPAPETAIVAEQETSTADKIIGFGSGVSAAAGLAAWATPAAVAHSSGMAILWSGTGYVAGTIGMTAATVAALPAIAIGGTVVAVGATAYKYSDEIAEAYDATVKKVEEITGDK